MVTSTVQENNGTTGASVAHRYILYGSSTLMTSPMADVASISAPYSECSPSHAVLLHLFF